MNLKPSEWLRDAIGSHDIADSAGLAADFREKTGGEPCWPTHTVNTTLAMIDSRGLGGNCPGEPESAVAWGYEVAEALARKYLPDFHSPMMGRGSRYRFAMEELQAIGR